MISSRTWLHVSAIKEQPPSDPNYKIQKDGFYNCNMVSDLKLYNPITVAKNPSYLYLAVRV
jgi:hypothetical protein